MWRFNPFTQKEPTGLEGRTIDVGSLKIHVRNAIAEGGFSCVYLARDAATSTKQYALKHIICNDGESLELTMKEISAMKLLKGHPNVVTLVAHAVFDMGRTKEAMLVMEFCDRTLVAALESRGGAYLEEKQAMVIFKDVCNAVRAMHSQSPPIAHRDLKAENVLLGPDGLWKLSDFGSISTNHKCFDRPEEMGLEEDNIRKHTTPAYRAPEMWDLFRKEVISEKVDIWALGCLLYRICYLKSAFDGESKLQVMNGNYRIPELPTYSTSVTSLIKDMLEASPDARPDITQVLSRVNEQLPVELRMHLPDALSTTNKRIPAPAAYDEGLAQRTPSVTRRSPPPPSAKEQIRISPARFEKEMVQSRPSQGAAKVTSSGGPIGTFWSTQHAQDSQVIEDKGTLIDREQSNQNLIARNQNNYGVGPKLQYESANGNTSNRLDNGRTKDSDVKLSQDDSKTVSRTIGVSQTESKVDVQNNAFSAFVAEFNTSTLNSSNCRANASNIISRKEEVEAEVDRLKEQLKQANAEKAEVTSKYEKLSAICRSQRQELQELKQALAAATARDRSRSQMPTASSQPSTAQSEKIEGGLWELQQGMFANNSAAPSPESNSWQAFANVPKAQPAPGNNLVGSIWTTGNHQNNVAQATLGPANGASWANSSTLAPTGPQISRTCVQGSTSQRVNGAAQTKKVESTQPAGWAGF